LVASIKTVKVKRKRLRDFVVTSWLRGRIEGGELKLVAQEAKEGD